MFIHSIKIIIFDIQIKSLFVVLYVIIDCGSFESVKNNFSPYFEGNNIDGKNIILLKKEFCLEKLLYLNF